MTIREYEELSRRTSNPNADHVTNGLLGMAGEVGECCDSVKKSRFQGHEFDREHLIEEAGDVLWYVREFLDGIGSSMEEACQKNIEKLVNRYPNGFEAERSVNRNV